MACPSVVPAALRKPAAAPGAAARYKKSGTVVAGRRRREDRLPGPERPCSYGSPRLLGFAPLLGLTPLLGFTLRFGLVDLLGLFSRRGFVACGRFIAADGVEDLAAVDGYFLWGLDPKADFVAPDLDDDNGDVVVDHDAFVLFGRVPTSYVPLLPARVPNPVGPCCEPNV